MTFTELYSQVPRIACKGKCQEACGLIAAHDSEIQHFEKAAGVVFPRALEVLESPEITCQHLNVLGRCQVYQHRPLVCRLWGVVDVAGMRCPHGCVPERWLSDAQARELLRISDQEVLP